MSEKARPVPQWVWVVISIALIGGLAVATLAIGVGVIAPRVAKSSHASAAASSSADPLPAAEDDFVMVHADRSQAASDIFAAATVTATARGLRPFVYTTAKWCEPCRKLNASLGDPRMKDAFKGTYIVKLDVDEFDAKVLEALGVRVRAVPSFYELGPSGTGTGRMLVGNWKRDVPEDMAPMLKGFFAGQ